MMFLVSPKAWESWKAICSVAGCDTRIREELYPPICEPLRKALDKLKADLPRYPNADLASLFEEYCRRGEAESGNEWKDALFDRCKHLEENQDQWSKALTGLIVTIASRPKSVASKIARHEGRTGPLRHAASYEDCARVLLDSSVLPDALVSLNELEAMAITFAQGFFSSLTNVQKAVVWGMALDLNDSDPQVLKLAGRQKSVVSDTRSKLGRYLVGRLGMTLTTNDSEALPALAVRITKAMYPLAIEWAAISSEREQSNPI